MKNKNFSSIESIIKIAKKGNMYILVDDENRENEGDLVIPAVNVSQKNINFMAKYGRGLICLALNNKQVKKLNLSLMSSVNHSRNQTAFTVSIEAKKGVTTGISAKDRAITIKTAIKSNVKKNDIVTPGHIFPIISKEGGVLVRAGHTEASVDISKLANKNPSAVICEIMNDKGVMAKGYELFQYWTDMEFILDGESLSWEEARELMIDSTGKYGPSNWELGSYKDGEERILNANFEIKSLIKELEEKKD